MWSFRTLWICITCQSYDQSWYNLFLMWSSQCKNRVSYTIFLFFRLFRLFRWFRLFKQSVEKKIWWLWLVEIAVMKLHDFIWSLFEVHSWLSERLEVSFISVSDIYDFVLNVKLLCLSTIHDFQHISFFMRFFFIAFCYQNWRLWFLNLFWIKIQ